jgi:hypothetical protein
MTVGDRQEVSGRARRSARAVLNQQMLYHARSGAPYLPFAQSKVQNCHAHETWPQRLLPGYQLSTTDYPLRHVKELAPFYTGSAKKFCFGKQKMTILYKFFTKRQNFHF